jgi:single-strand DNA-binding protein
MNSVNLVGRLTRDPEMKTTESGISISNFSIAVNRQFKNKDGEYEADFINCVAFKHTADFIQKYFSKGQFIGITGRIQTRKWQDNDGKTRYATEVIVENATFTSGKSETNNTAQFEEVTEPDDELPF